MRLLEELIGKEVRLYPSDSYKKCGTVEEVSEHGVVFTITEAESKSGYEVGKKVYIAFSARLSFSEI